MNDRLLVTFVTTPAGFDAEKFAATLVEEGMVACVNVVPGIRSVYQWNGETCIDNEQLCVLKLPERNFAALQKRVCELHPAEVPEIIAVDVEHGLPEYLAWASNPSKRVAD